MKTYIYLLILVITLLSCNGNSFTVSKELVNSTIKAEIINGKFHGVVKQTFNEQAQSRSILTKWENGVIRNIKLIERNGIERNMVFHKEMTDDSFKVYYEDINDESFTLIPVFNKEFLEFCEEHLLMSDTVLTDFNSEIVLFNIPENSFDVMSSPLPIKMEKNRISIVNNGFETDSLIISLIYWQNEKAMTDLKIRIKNAR